jgi:hypothetical protein
VEGASEKEHTDNGQSKGILKFLGRISIRVNDMLEHILGLLMLTSPRQVECKLRKIHQHPHRSREGEEGKPKRRMVGMFNEVAHLHK